MNALATTRSPAPVICGRASWLETARHESGPLHACVMIDSILGWIAARLWRHRVARRAEWVLEWERNNPGRCMYCSYTHWAREEKGVSLSFCPHNCIEGKSPPHPLPNARVIS
jgi:hypothetical protein